MGGGPPAGVSAALGGERKCAAVVESGDSASAASATATRRATLGRAGIAAIALREPWWSLGSRWKACRGSGDGAQIPTCGESWQANRTVFCDYGLSVRPIQAVGRAAATCSANAPRRRHSKTHPKNTSNLASPAQEFSKLRSAACLSGGARPHGAMAQRVRACATWRLAGRGQAAPATEEVPPPAPPHICRIMPQDVVYRACFFCVSPSITGDLCSSPVRPPTLPHYQRRTLLCMRRCRSSSGWSSSESTGCCCFCCCSLFIFWMRRCRWSSGCSSSVSCCCCCRFFIVRLRPPLPACLRRRRSR